MQPPQEKTAWELDKEASQHQHIHAPVPGYLLSQDGKLVGRLVGIGKEYVQVEVDCASSYGWIRLSTDKTADSAADFLIHVHHDYQSMGFKLQRVLTDNGREYGSSEPTYGHYYGATCLILGDNDAGPATLDALVGGAIAPLVAFVYLFLLSCAIFGSKFWLL